MLCVTQMVVKLKVTPFVWPWGKNTSKIRCSWLKVIAEIKKNYTHFLFDNSITQLFKYFWDVFPPLCAYTMPLNFSKEAMYGIFTAQIHWIQFQKDSEVPVNSRAELKGSNVTIGDL